MSCLPFWSFYCCLIYIFFLLLLYILLDLYSHLCSSIQLKTDWWAQMFGGKHNGEFSGDFASWPWRPGWIFISNIDVVHLDFIFKANIGFLIRWLTFCKPTSPKHCGRGWLADIKGPNYRWSSISSPTPQTTLWSALIFKCLSSWGLVSGLGELSCLGCIVSAIF